MSGIWVNQRDGDDSFSGTIANSAKKTIEAGIDAALPGQQIFILPGTYVDPVITTAKSLTFVAVGHVVLKSQVNGAFFNFGSSNTVSVDWRFRHLDFVNYKHVISYTHTADVNSSINIFFDNCTYFRETNVAGRAMVNVTNTSTVGVANVSIFMQNNTAAHASGTPVVWSVTGTVDMDIKWERNNLYSAVPEGSLSVIAGSGGSVTRVNHDYNAVFSNTEPNGASAAGFFYNTATDPFDIALDRDFNGSLIGAGEFGDDIGATWWPPTALDPDTLEMTEAFNRSKNDPTSNTAYFHSDWGPSGDGWANDESYCDSVTGLPGTGVPADVSPAVLLTLTFDPRWIINSVIGGGGSARVRGPVWDFGKPVRARSVTWFGEEDEAKVSGEKLVIDNDDVNSGRQIEFRASNSVFAADDAGPSWSYVRKDSDYDTSPFTTVGRKRYWQFRVVLRTDGT